MDKFDAIFKPSKLESAPGISGYLENEKTALSIATFQFQENIELPIHVSVGVTADTVLIQ